MREIFSTFLIFSCLCYINIYRSSCSSTQERHCREKHRTIGTDKRDFYKLIDVKYGQRVMLECHYCNEKDDKAPKIWYHQHDILNSNETEVKLDMKYSNLALNRVHITPNHTLVIQNISKNDTGLYYCHGILGEKKNNKYNFLLDAVANSTVSPLLGNLTKWRMYQETMLIPLNTLLQASQESKDYGIQLQAMSEWEPWGLCVTCNRPQGQGERRRLGKCRLKMTRHGQDNSLLESNKLKRKLLYVLSELSCYSELIAYMLPNISTIARNTPEFVNVENCVGTCSAGPHNTIAKEEQIKQTHPKVFIELAKGGSVTIVCPGATMESVVTWQKNKAIINSEFGQDVEEGLQGPHIIIDTFGSLKLNSVTHKEEGNYTCFIDNIKMQEVKVLIYSQSRLISKEKLRHIVYLGYIFLICFIFYCGQVIIACKKRHRFSGYNKSHI